MVKESANDRQVGGVHYKTAGDIPEHWDLAAMYRWDPFQYQITKYIMRWKAKGGIADLRKAQHFLEKYIELAEQGAYYAHGTDTTEPHSRGYVDQD